MSKTIKVIDLLNKIANGEEVPRKIKAFSHIFKREKDVDGVWYYLDGFLTLLSLLNTTAVLNDTVEIIEEEPEIDIQEIKEVEIEDIANIDGYAPDRIKNKINQLIRALKQLDKQINNK